MLRSEAYEAFAAAAERRGVILRTSPEAYRRAHELPGWYDAVREVTPQTVWTSGSDRAQFLDRLVELAPGPVVVRDYTKSMKHYWHEAAFIPDAGDADAQQREREAETDEQGRQAHARRRAVRRCDGRRCAGRRPAQCGRGR